VLVLIGTLFLLHNFNQNIPVWRMFEDYWPVLLIAMGVFGLIEVLYWASRTPANQPGPAYMPRPIGGGWIFLVLAIACIAWAANNHRIQLGNFRGGGVTILGSDYQYDVNTAEGAAGARRVVLDNLHGDLTVKISDTPEVRVTGHKTVRAYNSTEARRGNEQSPISIDHQGDSLVVRAGVPGDSRIASISGEFDIALPRNVDLEVRGRSGDLTIDGVSGAVQVGSGSGDVRLSNIGKDVRVESAHGGLVRLTGIAGNIDVEGRGSDVRLENIQGEVTLNGEYSGDLEFRGLHKPMHFVSSRSDLRVEQIPGWMTLDPGDLRMENVVGPVHFQSRSRDVEITDATDAVELSLDRGDVHVMQHKSPVPKMDVHTRAGDVTVTLPAGGGFELDAKSGQGDASNQFGSPLEQTRENRGGAIRGKVGTGPRVVLDTTRGDITVRKN
jgi:DUF4097 and DUF4098 domain-containing protein YvlB